MRGWIWYCCPGLKSLWNRGTWGDALFALAAITLLNLALVNSLTWTELCQPGVKVGLWVLVAIVWVAAALSLPPEPAVQDIPKPEDLEPVFVSAMEQYLRGNYAEAQKRLTQLLQKQPQDVEAGLLLVSVLRRLGKRSEARRQLAATQRFPESVKWQHEMAVEAQRLESPEPLAVIANRESAPAETRLRASAA